jgi:hypothetical protein
MFKHVLYADLRKMFDKTGPWDAVLFTGDLTQKGSFEEFDQLSRALEELWVQLAELGCSPVLLPIPGNHDLQRPDRKKKPATLLLKQWWNTPEVREELWENSRSLYRHTVNDAFANYSKWLERLDGRIKLPRGIRRGMLPGDLSASLETRAGLVGIVGLNSAWLPGSLPRRFGQTPSQC